VRSLSREHGTVRATTWVMRGNVPRPGERMPYVNIKITREGATTEQKAELIRGVTELLRDTLGKNPATTVVVIEEVDTDNWGIGGESITVRRKRGS
jgi:4-oxalocrotonate tautomerase